jgi:hypothetical protein
LPYLHAILICSATSVCRTATRERQVRFSRADKVLSPASAAGHAEATQRTLLLAVLLSALPVTP